MLANQSHVGVVLTCRTSLILRRTILKLRLSSWRKTTVQPRKFSKHNEVIKNNRNRRPKKLWTQNDDGEQIVYYRANDERDEAVLLLQLLITLFVKKVSKLQGFRCTLPYQCSVSYSLKKLYSSLIPYTMVEELSSIAARNS